MPIAQSLTGLNNQERRITSPLYNHFSVLHLWLEAKQKTSMQPWEPCLVVLSFSLMQTLGPFQDFPHTKHSRTQTYPPPSSLFLVNVTVTACLLGDMLWKIYLVSNWKYMASFLPGTKITFAETYIITNLLSQDYTNLHCNRITLFIMQCGFAPTNKIWLGQQCMFHPFCYWVWRTSTQLWIVN